VKQEGKREEMERDGHIDGRGEGKEMREREIIMMMSNMMIVSFVLID
jgi:hypothetical protein